MGEQAEVGGWRAMCLKRHSSVGPSTPPSLRSTINPHPNPHQTRSSSPNQLILLPPNETSNSALSASGSDLGEPYTEDSDLESAHAPDSSDAGGASSSSAPDEAEVPLTRLQVGVRAVGLLAAGTALCGVFAGECFESVGARFDVWQEGVERGGLGRRPGHRGEE